MRVVVVGGGVAGLGAALAFARDGHTVTIVERDDTPMPDTPSEAFAHWQRRGAPQVRHSHAFLARLHNLLRDRAPDVLTALLDAGATELLFTQHPPETLVGFEPQPDDNDLVALACRRTTFEWVLRRAVLAIDGVDLVHGAAVEGLRVDDSVRLSVPRVTGVVLHSREGVGTLDADLVLDASGPHSASASWLHAVGAIEPDPTVHESGIIYLSRFYELVDGAEPPEMRGPIGGDLGYLKYAVFVGDNRTFSITLAVDSGDHDLRPLTHRDAFEQAAGCLEAARLWRDGRSAPITDVHLMAGLRNRRRMFVVDGNPLVTGFAAVGDASVCTNPLYGRGCSLGMVHAFDAADAWRDTGADGFEVAFDALTARDLEPWFKSSVLQDRESKVLAQASATPPAGGDARPSEDPRAFMRDVFQGGLVPALRTSPVVFRAFLRWFNLLAEPETLMADSAVINAVLAAYHDRHNRPPEPAVGPDRAAMLAAIGPVDGSKR